MDHSGLVGIYLAAGRSTRMGRPKVNLRLGNRLLGGIALREALESKLDSTFVITRQGDPLEWLAPFSNSEGLRIVECKEADKGQSASLRVGVMVASETGAAGIVVLLADQPFVTTKMINQLIDEYHESEQFVAFSHHGVMKPPVLLANSLFPRIKELEGDQGARSLLRSGCLGKQIKLNKDVYFFDVDTEEDYQFLLKNRPFL